MHCFNYVFNGFFDSGQDPWTLTNLLFWARVFHNAVFSLVRAILVVVVGKTAWHYQKKKKKSGLQLRANNKYSVSHTYIWTKYIDDYQIIFAPLSKICTGE